MGGEKEQVRRVLNSDDLTIIEVSGNYQPTNPAYEAEKLAGMGKQLITIPAIEPGFHQLGEDHVTYH